MTETKSLSHFPQASNEKPSETSCQSRTGRDVGSFRRLGDLLPSTVIMALRAPSQPDSEAA